MVYFPNIPQPTDRPSDSQGQILQNFQTLDTVFTVDHIAFSAGVNFGKHKQVTFDTNHAAGAPAGTESVLYTKNVGGVPGLFWRNSVAEMPISPNAGGGGIFAWCLFNGATGAIVSSYNIASVVRNGVGDYTVNYTTPLVSGLPGASFVFTQGTNPLGLYTIGRLSAGGPAFSTIRTVRVSTSGGLTTDDVAFCNFMILGS